MSDQQTHYYWAKFETDEDWQIVMINSRNHVFVMGIDDWFRREQFKIGPEVCKPDELE